MRAYLVKLNDYFGKDAWEYRDYKDKKVIIVTNNPKKIYKLYPIEAIKSIQDFGVGYFIE